jgi:hypothetical protein
VKVWLPSSWAVAALLLLCAAPLSAQPHAPENVEHRPLHVALRTGFGIPFGSYAEARETASFRDMDVNRLSDDTHGVIPLWLDLGYRPNAHLMLGGYVMYGVVLPKTAPAEDPSSGGCPEDVDCFAYGIRLGVQAQYALAPGSFVDPWFGLGFGLEWIHSQLKGQVLGFIPVDSVSSHSGMELVHLQGGADLHLTPALAIGPFAAVSALQYTRCSAELMGNEADCRIVDAAWHGWLVLGVRGVLGI